MRNKRQKHTQHINNNLRHFYKTQKSTQHKIDKIYVSRTKGSKQNEIKINIQQKVIKNVHKKMQCWTQNYAVKIIWIIITFKSFITKSMIFIMCNFFVSFILSINLISDKSKHKMQEERTERGNKDRENIFLAIN